MKMKLTTSQISSDKLMDIFWQKFGTFPDTHEETTLFILRYYLGTVKGKRVLDIGAGDSSKDDGTFAPTLCRVLQEEGAEVTGIDPLLVPEKETFKIYPNVIENVESKLQDSYFDAVVSQSFFGVPLSNYISSKHRDKHRYEIDRIRNITRVLKANGYLVLYIGEPIQGYITFGEKDLERAGFIMAKTFESSYETGFILKDYLIAQKLLNSFTKE